MARFEVGTIVKFKDHRIEGVVVYPWMFTKPGIVRVLWDGQLSPDDALEDKLEAVKKENTDETVELASLQPGDVFDWNGSWYTFAFLRGPYSAIIIDHLNRALDLVRTTRVRPVR